MKWHFPEEQPDAKERVLVAAPAPQRTLVAAPMPAPAASPLAAPAMSRQEVDAILERVRLRKEKAEQDKARAKAERDAAVQRTVARISPDLDLLNAVYAKTRDYGTYLRYKERLLNTSTRAATLDELSNDPDMKPFVDKARR